jgi:SAM-dependent methyltransferase
MSDAPADTFSAAWLALRAPYDRAARSKPLARDFLSALPRNGRVADLACGTGANARHLTALGRRDLRWTLMDADPALLRTAGDGLPGSPTRCVNLARPRRALGLGGFDGVTASALCDLVSGPWLGKVISKAARHGLPLLFALNVDGRIAFSPEDAEDGTVLRRFRRDQARDKGFGPALGPRAPLRLAAALRAHGYRLRVARSDWRLGAADGALLEALVDGIAAAGGAPVDGWRRRRRAQIAARRLAAVVGHIDVFASFPR